VTNICIWPSYLHLVWMKKKKLNNRITEFSTLWNRNFCDWRISILVTSECYPPCCQTVSPITRSAINYSNLPLCDSPRSPNRSRFLPQTNFWIHFLRTAAAKRSRTGSLNKTSLAKKWVGLYVQGKSCTVQFGLCSESNGQFRF
jgi:hypothetical protein